MLKLMIRKNRLVKDTLWEKDLIRREEVFFPVSLAGKKDARNVETNWSIRKERAPITALNVKNTDGDSALYWVG